MGRIREAEHSQQVAPMMMMMMIVLIKMMMIMLLMVILINMMKKVASLQQRIADLEVEKTEAAARGEQPSNQSS